MEKSMIKSAFTNRLKLNYAPQGKKCKVQQTNNDQWPQMTKKTDSISISKRQLQQMISAEVQRRIMPLIARIQRLQYDRNCGFSLNGQSSYFGNFDENRINFDEEMPIQEQGQNLSTLWAAPPSNKRSLDKIVKKQSTPYVDPQPVTVSQDVSAYCQKLDQIVVIPQHQTQWNELCHRMKNIFRHHAVKGNIWSEQQKNFVVNFVEFGREKLGFRTIDMMNLTRISKSSYKRWKKTT